MLIVISCEGEPNEQPEPVAITLARIAERIDKGETEGANGDVSWWVRSTDTRVLHAKGVDLCACCTGIGYVSTTRRP